ncbi:DNA-binding protein WhiA [Metaclostridioides mangenotii]|uniref:Probable cell division protein WhiA n=1 Tax=Metaclostridioides mangenotii TaxID=1540 RepID=A0ABS4EAD6_9FIRM|nr:DNA-binding protein WhiA [Clostridioides mangenotii]MBP1854907.1 DNA-binding protein WhiA [Clostridioides mangenotii]
MSFSTDTKNELARILPEERSVAVAELAAIVKSAGSLQIAGYKKINLKILTELNSIARKVFKLLKNNFDINTTISINKNQMLKRNNSYVLTVTDEMGATELLRELGMLEPGDGFFTVDKVPEKLVEQDECKRAFLRGAFLGGGSISDPDKSYHMEFVTNSEEFAISLKDLINSIGLNSKIVPRKSNYIVYLKESEQISDLLSVIGAHNALLSLQNTKILKEMRNNVNRIVNCETANLSKTVNAAVRQVEDINLIQRTIGISNLPNNLQEIAQIRVEYEDMTLKELGEMLDPPIGKSGVNHRLRKLGEIADGLREENNL